MRKIAVFTGTRAEYGLLFWLIKAIEKDPDLVLQLIVTGTHLSPNFGETWQEIEADGFSIDAKIEMLISSNTSVGVVKSLGLATIGLADALARLRPDIIIILGDRYEALAAAQASLIMNIPIAHIHGGELTMGAYDDAIRHAITKMAAWHFVATERYKKRVLQLGEEPSRVFNVGALGVEHLSKMKKMTFEDLTHELKISLSRPFFLVTYHPVTISKTLGMGAFDDLLRVLDDLQAYQIIFTYPNADNGGYELIEKLEHYCQLNPERAFAVKSLGHKRYLNLAACAEVVIGNSSSGIVEIPSLGIPTVDIGNRQEGRLRANSVLHCDEHYSAIKEAVYRAIQSSFKEQCHADQNPYGTGPVSERIVTTLKRVKLFQIKRFQDMDFDNAK